MSKLFTVGILPLLLTACEPTETTTSIESSSDRHARQEQSGMTPSFSEAPIQDDSNSAIEIEADDDGYAVELEPQYDEEDYVLYLEETGAVELDFETEDVLDEVGFGDQEAELEEELEEEFEAELEEELEEEFEAELEEELEEEFEAELEEELEEEFEEMPWGYYEENGTFEQTIEPNLLTKDTYREVVSPFSTTRTGPDTTRLP